MKFNNVIVIAVGLLAGCVSEQFEKDIAEFDQWQKSSDYVRNTTFPEFRKRYQVGWRERVEIKEKQKQIEKEKIKSLKEDYELWCKSEDYVSGVTLWNFQHKKEYRGWRERVEEFEEWKKSADYSPEITYQRFYHPVKSYAYRNGWRERAEKKELQRKEYEAYLASPIGDSSVSQSDFLFHHKDWRERLKKHEQLVAHEKKKVSDPLSLRAERIQKIVENELASILAAYSKGGKYNCPYMNNATREWMYNAISEAQKKYKNEYKEYIKDIQEGGNGDSNWKRPYSQPYYESLKQIQYKAQRAFEEQCKNDWLQKWIEPRLGLSEEDKLAGEAILAEFGAKYLPNTYSKYEESKNKALVLQQGFNEAFPEPWTMKESNSKWKLFNKILENFVRIRTEYFWLHDELCHYWRLWRFGIMTPDELAKADVEKRYVDLMPENIKRDGFTLMEVNFPSNNLQEFSAKYAPDTFAVYKKLEAELKVLNDTLNETGKQRIQMDDVRFNRVLYAACLKHNEIVRRINQMTKEWDVWMLDHKTMLKTAEDIAGVDKKLKVEFDAFIATLPDFIKTHVTGPVVSKSEMIKIPGKNYYVQKTEVTQFQWMLVFGNCPPSNPNHKPDLPLFASNDHCREFIKRLNIKDGKRYRLPTKDEWEYARRAGASGKYCKLHDGTEITDNTIDIVAWYPRINAVGMKTPNAFGLYDIVGNARERLACDPWNTPSYPGDARDYVGFRLVCDE